MAIVWERPTYDYDGHVSTYVWFPLTPHMMWTHRIRIRPKFEKLKKHIFTITWYTWGVLFGSLQYIQYFVHMVPLSVNRLCWCCSTKQLFDQQEDTSGFFLFLTKPLPKEKGK